jgi:hypothetical protein
MAVSDVEDPDSLSISSMDMPDTVDLDSSAYAALGGPLQWDYLTSCGGHRHDILISNSSSTSRARSPDTRRSSGPK